MAINKIDLEAQREVGPMRKALEKMNVEAFPISAVTGEGLDRSRRPFSGDFSMGKANEILLSRRELLRHVRRAVVKVGSGVLTGRDGLNGRVIHSLTRDICALKEGGIEIILVSSGAISSGHEKDRAQQTAESLSQKQALAAVGQPSLMMSYERAFERHGQKVAQILITRDDLNNRRRYLNARNTIFTLLSWRIVPIFNENDTVSVDEIKFGDNDNLSAMVTNLTESQLLVNLTDMDGLFDKDPRTNRDARLIRGRGKGTAMCFGMRARSRGLSEQAGWPARSRQARRSRLPACRRLSPTVAGAES